MSDLYRAQKLKETWQALLDTLHKLDQDLTQRRSAYLDALQQVAYIGADIPDGTSPADKAVLMQAFSNTLDRARSMGQEQMQRALAEAEKFGDDQGQRAIETAMLEKGRIDLLRPHLAAVNPDRLAALDQLDDARRAVQRVRVEDGFAWQHLPHPSRRRRSRASQSSRMLKASTRRPGFVGSWGSP